MVRQSKFLQRLQGQTSTDGGSNSLSLSPLQNRLCEGIASLSQGVGLPPQAQVMIGGMVKHLRRSPIPDEQITASLTWLQQLLANILLEPIPAFGVCGAECEVPCAWDHSGSDDEA